jgi:hypothetical protein
VVAPPDRIHWRLLLLNPVHQIIVFTDIQIGTAAVKHFSFEKVNQEDATQHQEDYEDKKNAGYVAHGS